MFIDSLSPSSSGLTPLLDVMLDQLLKQLPKDWSFIFSKERDGRLVFTYEKDPPDKECIEYENFSVFSQELQSIFDSFKRPLVIVYRKNCFVAWYGGSSPIWPNSGGFRTLKELKEWLLKFQLKLDVALLNDQSYVSHERKS